MLQHLIGAQGNREMVLGSQTSRTLLKQHDRPAVQWGLLGFRQAWDWVGFILAEYVWGHLILAVTFVGSAPLVADGHSAWRQRVGVVSKRGIDVLGATAGIVLSLPFFVLLPIVIKLDSPGPIFYRQLRIGYNRRRRDRRGESASTLGRSTRDRRRQDLRGRPFHVIKFRTMVADAEKKCGPVWATKNDPRITRLGRLLRKTRLDELPQFVNVLLGQMSLVGPRPERPKFVQELSAQVENYERRLMVKPGLTGLAQIESGYDSSVASVVRKVHYDLQYIQNWSLWQDVKIMMRTVLVVITGKGAF